MNITVLGAGIFGTAIANELSFNLDNDVILFSRCEKKVNEINNFHTNKIYFPNKHLHDQLKASSNKNILKKANIVFIALPSNTIIKTLLEYQSFFNKNVLFVNLSKGIFSEGITIVSGIKKALNTNNVVTLKGPSFAVELMERSDTLLTLGYEDEFYRELLIKIVHDTSIYLDFTNDIKGVEILSVIKNIYALFLGIVDAKYNSSNTRFMVLTKTFSEVRLISKNLGCYDDTLFLACGFGDFCLTSLNDLSRNRTLGLLIGKGFYSKDYNANKVITEGLNAINIVYSLLDEQIKLKLPIFQKLHNFINDNELIIKIDFDDLNDIK